MLFIAAEAAAAHTWNETNKTEWKHKHKHLFVVDPSNEIFFCCSTKCEYTVSYTSPVHTHMVDERSVAEQRWYEKRALLEMCNACLKDENKRYTKATV